MRVKSSRLVGILNHFRSNTSSGRIRSDDGHYNSWIQERNYFIWIFRQLQYCLIAWRYTVWVQLCKLLDNKKTLSLCKTRFILPANANAIRMLTLQNSQRNSQWVEPCSTHLREEGCDVKFTSNSLRIRISMRYEPGLTEQFYWNGAHNSISHTALPHS